MLCEIISIYQHFRRKVERKAGRRTSDSKRIKAEEEKSNNFHGRQFEDVQMDFDSVEKKKKKYINAEFLNF